MAITAVDDPSVLDQGFTTIGRTSARMFDDSFVLVIRPLTSLQDTRPKPMRTNSSRNHADGHSFGNAIRRKRLRLGMTQLELADQLGVGVKTLSLWERNKQRPRLTHKSRVEDWLGIVKVPQSELPDRVRAKRMEWGMTQRDLAEYLRVNYMSIKYWESGRYTPSAENYELICEWLSQDITARTDRGESQYRV